MFKAYRMAAGEIRDLVPLMPQRTGSMQFGARYDSFIDHLVAYMTAGTREQRTEAVRASDAAFGERTERMLANAARGIEQAAAYRQYDRGGTDPHQYIGEPARSVAPRKRVIQ